MVRQYERFSSEPDNQLRLPIAGLDDDTVAAEKWIAEHPQEWRYILRCASRDANFGKVSMRSCVEAMRREFRTGCPNALTPAMSRIAERDVKSLKGVFTKSRSRADGF